MTSVGKHDSSDFPTLDEMVGDMDQGGRCVACVRKDEMMMTGSMDSARIQAYQASMGNV
jgi:hypothetical protein